MTVDDEYEPKDDPIEPAKVDPVAVVRLPCGCDAVVDHLSGDRGVVCEGGGLRPDPDDATGVGPSLTCPGGRGYVLTAELQPPKYKVTARTRVFP